MPQTTLNYRPIQPTDLPVLNKMMRAAKGHWGYSEDQLDRFMDSYSIKDTGYFKEAYGYIAESPEGIAGYYVLNTAESAPKLDQFILNTELIGKGLGRQLWNHCVAESQKKGWNEIAFCSDPNSCGFFEHMGAIKVGEKPMVTVPGRTSPLMRFSVPN